jgi:hypothetical protein
MGSEYSWRKNPFQDFLLNSILEHKIDISSKKYYNSVYNGFVTILAYFLDDDTLFQHLDFDIKKKKKTYKLVANNALSALWFIGVFPKDVNNVLITNEYVNNEYKYSYNQKTKVITYIEIVK